MAPSASLMLEVRLSEGLVHCPSRVLARRALEVYRLILLLLLLYPCQVATGLWEFTGSIEPVLSIQLHMVARTTMGENPRHNRSAVMGFVSMVNCKCLAAVPSLFGPQIRRGYPLNLSISFSGGKETKEDSPSNGERMGTSPAPNLPSLGGKGCGVWERHSSDAVPLSKSVGTRPFPEEGDRPV